MLLLNLSIDCVVLGFDKDQKLKVLLIKKFINERNDFRMEIDEKYGFANDINDFQCFTKPSPKSRPHVSSEFPPNLA